MTNLVVMGYSHGLYLNTSHGKYRFMEKIQPKPLIKLKRAYEKPSADDGERVLVDRLPKKYKAELKKNERVQAFYEARRDTKLLPLFMLRKKSSTTMRLFKRISRTLVWRRLVSVIFLLLFNVRENRSSSRIKKCFIFG